MSFVFYDTETTGKRKFFDQILQFSAIRTNDDFDEIERIDTRCRLLPYVVPSPEALQTNRITAAQLVDPLLPSHYEMIRSVRDKLLSWSPTLFVGYNSIDFDEHLLRQALYQTLHDPYLTNGNRNCRADVLRLARAVHTYCPNAMAVPAYPDGRPCFRLQDLAPANGFQGDKAHDALFDVSATIFICKVIKDQAPEFWFNFLKFTQKAAVEHFVRDEVIFCLSDFFQGATRTAFVTSLGPSSRSTDLLIFDLSVDPEGIVKMSNDQVQALCAYPHTAVRELRTNACPIIFEKDLLPESVDLGLSELQAGKRAKYLQENDKLKERLRGAFESSRRPFPASRYVEQQLYGGRQITNHDRDQLETFHATPWERRLSIIDRFEDRRFKQLGRRLLFVERPDTLAPDVQEEMKHMLAKRVLEGDSHGTWLSLREAVAEAELLLGGAPEPDASLLRAHHAAFKTQLDKLSAGLR